MRETQIQQTKLIISFVTLTACLHQTRMASCHTARVLCRHSVSICTKGLHVSENQDIQQHREKDTELKWYDKLKSQSVFRGSYVRLYYDFTTVRIQAKTTYTIVKAWLIVYKWWWSFLQCKGFTSLLLQVSVKERLLTRYQHTTDRETGPWALTASDTLTEPQQHTQRAEKTTQRVRGDMTETNTHKDHEEQKSPSQENHDRETADNLNAEVREYESTDTESVSQLSEANIIMTLSGHFPSP